MDTKQNDADGGRSGPHWSRINQWVLWLGLAAAVLWMLYRHNAHLVQLVPFLLVLACPLMHLFGHGRHGGHRHGDAAPKAHDTHRDSNG